MHNEPIKSPYAGNGKRVDINALESKLKKIVRDEDFEGCLYFFLPKEGSIILGTFNFCGHQMVKIAEMIKEKGEEQIERDGAHDCQE